MVTASARKQRKRMYNAPLHVRTQLVSAHVEKKRGREDGVPRSLPLRKGDQVRVMRGGPKVRGQIGKVLSVDRRNFRVVIDGIRMKKADEKEVERPLHPSNLMIIALDESDPRRRRRMLDREEKA